MAFTLVGIQSLLNPTDVNIVVGDICLLSNVESVDCNGKIDNVSNIFK